MTKKLLTLLSSLSLCYCAMSQTVEKGPYTVSILADGVYRIEDANHLNPSGEHPGMDGKPGSMNNCSDMYLVTGKDKALLIDLSNAVTWDSTATESLRSLVYERIGTKELLITVTHKHGDHLGMLPAFSKDPRAHFRIPGAEFSGTSIFPADRTSFFSENAKLDLGGGFVIQTLDLPGHTAHSTLFFLEDKNIVFTGDAIGSGNGVWLFNEESFPLYRNSIHRLIAYLEDPANHCNPDKLIIYGGHYWQKGKAEDLTARYIYDMRSLVEAIGKGTAESEKVSFSFPFLDTNFKYGTATITWNKEAAERFAKSSGSE
jgi:glyoxylase-like metal-dependent hydrolase (beta-lactamase superfamily II)